VGPDNDKFPMLPVKSGLHLFEIYFSDRVQAYSFKIILYIQLQNHEYFYSGVTTAYLNPQYNIKVSILMISTFFVNLTL